MCLLSGWFLLMVFMAPCADLGNNLKWQSELIRRKNGASVGLDFEVVNMQSVLITPMSLFNPAVGQTQDLLVHLNCHCFSPFRGSKGVSILTQELTFPGLISILGELKELLMECDIWAWIIYVYESSFR